MTVATPAKYDPAMIEPQAPHDDCSFEELAGRYNFRRTSFDVCVLTRLIIKECATRERPIRVLDIGCGRGIARNVGFQWAIREHVDEYWGLEPDPNVKPAEGLFDHHVNALLEDADLPADAFDVAYSSMVMEHVADPDGFMTAIQRCLKPGGVYVFMTPNLRHYFARTASMLHALKLDEFVLQKVIRRPEVDEYHYPVQYRFNDERRIDACAKRLGLEPPEYVYLEDDGPRPYLPGPLKIIFHALALKRYAWKSRKALMRMVCRITKLA